MRVAIVSCRAKLEMKRFYSAVKLKAGHLKIDFVSADIKDDFNKILTSFLIKRSKIK